MPRARDQHFLGPIAYFTIPLKGSTAKTEADDGNSGGSDDEGKGITIGAGALFGLNDDTPDTTIKLSVETGF